MPVVGCAAEPQLQNSNRLPVAAGENARAARVTSNRLDGRLEVGRSGSGFKSNNRHQTRVGDAVDNQGAISGCRCEERVVASPLHVVNGNGMRLGVTAESRETFGAGSWVKQGDNAGFVCGCKHAPATNALVAADTFTKCISIGRDGRDVCAVVPQGHARGRVAAEANIGPARHTTPLQWTCKMREHAA